jgi:predicted TIM-barrel fold metal-dependent hydrolase
VIVDTHVHVVAPDQGRYPLRPSGIGSQWFREHPVSAEEYAAAARDADVERAVLVQAHGAYGADNRYVVDAVATAPDRFVSVCIVDPGDPDPAATLRALAREPGVAGVRLFGIGAAPPTWFDDAPGAALWAAAIDLELRLVATLLTPDLPRLVRMAARFPDVPVVLDHCGFPDLTGGPPYRSAQPLFALADLPSVHLKVTSHLLEDAGPRSPDGAVALVDRLAATFGPERLVWGSDYPQTHDRPYAELVALGRHAAASLAPTDRDAFLGGNALRLWPALVHPR